MVTTLGSIVLALSFMVNPPKIPFPAGEAPSTHELGQGAGNASKPIRCYETIPSYRQLIYDAYKNGSTSLDLSHLDNFIKGEDIAGLASLTNLRELTLDAVGLSDKELSCLPKLKLQRLHLKYASNLDILNGCDNLQFLWIENSRCQPQDFETIAKLPHLLALSITNTNLDDAGLAKFENSEIEWLKLSGVNVTNDGYKSLAHFKKLQSLECDAPYEVRDDLLIHSRISAFVRSMESGLPAPKHTPTNHPMAGGWGPGAREEWGPKAKRELQDAANLKSALENSPRSSSSNASPAKR
jgi:hypothetical protein